jgi:uncharacterized protein (DUF736 family)
MFVGTFRKSVGGDWIGRLITLTMDRSLRFERIRLRKDSKKRKKWPAEKNGPDYRVMCEDTVVGDGWSVLPDKNEVDRDGGLIHVLLEDPLWKRPKRASLIIRPNREMVDLYWGCERPRGPTRSADVSSSAQNCQ